MAMSTVQFFHIIMVLCLLMIAGAIWISLVIRAWMLVVGEIDIAEVLVSATCDGRKFI
jgi:hypothetical protein